MARYNLPSLCIVCSYIAYCILSLNAYKWNTSLSVLFDAVMSFIWLLCDMLPKLVCFGSTGNTTKQKITALLISWSKIFGIDIYMLIYSLVPVVCPCLYLHSLLRLNQNRIGFMAKSSTSALDKCRQFSFFIAAVFRWNQCIWRVWVYVFFLLHLC